MSGSSSDCIKTSGSSSDCIKTPSRASQDLPDIPAAVLAASPCKASSLAQRASPLAAQSPTPPVGCSAGKRKRGSSLSLSITGKAGFAVSIEHAKENESHEQAELKPRTLNLCTDNVMMGLLDGKAHASAVEDMADLIPCEFCGISVPASELEAHEKTHLKQCLHCFRFVLHEEFEMHQQAHLEADRRNLGGSSAEAIAVRLLQHLRSVQFHDACDKVYAVNFDLTVSFVKRYLEMVSQRGLVQAAPKTFFHWTPSQNICSIMDNNLQVPAQLMSWNASPFRPALLSQPSSSTGPSIVYSRHGAAFGRGIYGSPDFEYGRRYGHGATVAFACLGLTGIQGNTNGVTSFSCGDGRLYEIEHLGCGWHSGKQWQYACLESEKADGTFLVTPFQSAGPACPVPARENLCSWSSLGKEWSQLPQHLEGRAYHLAPGFCWGGMSPPLAVDGSPLLALAFPSASNAQAHQRAEWVVRMPQKTVSRAQIRPAGQQLELGRDFDSIAEQKACAKAEEWVLPQSSQVLPCYLVDSTMCPVATAAMEKATQILQDAVRNTEFVEAVVIDDDDC